MDVSDYYDTTETDGVFLQVEIIDYLETFVNKLIEKARYFQNIKFNFDADVINALRHTSWGNKLVTLNKDFKIFKSEDFQYSTLNRNDKIHICLDQYAYDIKWEEVGLNPINLPIALRFNLNDFEVNPTREVISITPDYKDKIIDKLIKVADWFVDKYNEVNPEVECKDLKHYKSQLEFRSYRKVTLDNNHLDVFDFCFNFSSKSFADATFKNISKSTLNDFNKFMSRYSYKFYEGIAQVRFGTLSRNVGFINDENSYFISKSFARTYQTYFKTVLRNEESRIYRKKPVKLVFSNPEENEIGFLEYMRNYEKVNSDKLTEDQLIALKKLFSDFNLLLAEFEKVTPTVENTVPEDFIKSLPKTERKKKNKVEKGDDEIILKYPREPQKYISWSAVWEDKPVKVNELKRLKALHIYGTESKRVHLEELFLFTNGIQTIMVTDKIEKIIKDENPQNFIHVNNIKEKFTSLANYFTALYIKNEMVGYKFLFDNIDLIEKYISKPIADDIKELKLLMSKYNVNNKVYDKSIIYELYELYKANPKLYNQEHVFILNKVNKIKQNLDFLQLFAEDLRNVGSQYSYKSQTGELALRTMREILKAKKVRMNWENYNLDKVEDFKPIITKSEEPCEV